MYKSPMTTYTVNVYGAYKADSREFEVEAQSLNHAAKAVRDMKVQNAMSIFIKVQRRQAFVSC